MSRLSAIVTSDWHLESGAHLGGADERYGSSRLLDAERVLGEIAATPADVLIFAGDLAKNARPGPTAYHVAAKALNGAAAKEVVLFPGNHDYSGEVASCIHVLADAVPRATVIDRPRLHVTQSGLQIGVLPWAPPMRLFKQAGHRPREISRRVAEGLTKIAYKLGRECDPSQPAILVGHWFVYGTSMAQGFEVAETHEPLLRAEDLEASGPWSAVVMGHNHSYQQAAAKTWVCGPPLRGGFGEAEVPVGYMRFEWESGTIYSVKHVPTTDRRLVTIDLDVPSLVGALDPTMIATPDVDGAIVRVRGACSEADAQTLASTGRLRDFVDRLYREGAAKIIGPQLTVERVRRERSDLTVDVDPKRALDAYLDSQDVHDPVRAQVLREAERIMR